MFAVRKRKNKRVETKTPRTAKLPSLGTTTNRYTHRCTHTYIYTDTHTHTYAHIYTYTHGFTQIHIYRYTQIYTYTHREDTYTCYM